MLKMRVLNRCGSLALLLLGILPLSALLVQTFSLSVSPLMPLWLGLLCLCLWLASFGKKPFLVFTVLSAALVALCVWRSSVDLMAEGTDLIGRIRFVYLQYLVGSTDRPPAAELGHTGPLLLFDWLLAAYLSLTLNAGRSRIAFSVAGTLPVFVGCIAVNGEPQPWVIFCLALFYLLLFLSGGEYREESGRGALLWLTAAPCALVLLLCLRLADPANYSFDEEDVLRSRRFDRISYALSATVQLVPPEPTPTPKPTPSPKPTARPRIGSGNWGGDRGELDMRTGPYADEEQVLLEVRAETTECMYLRRCSYGDYAGSRWLPDEGEAPLASLGLAAAAMSGPAHSAKLSLRRGSELMLLPYFSPLSGEEDAFVPSDGERDYTVSYYSAGSGAYALRLTGEAAEQELLYRPYAHEHFTALPETTAFSAGVLLQEAGITAEDPQLIEKIAAYVRQSGRYDLSVRPSQSADYAIFFLTQSHRGYCVHFASAACVLYRAAGVPARVADGFMFNAKAGETVEVKQGDEHAWVEVYIDGLGWMPVEATAGSGFAYGSGDGTEAGAGEGEPEEQEERLPSPFAPEDGAWVQPTPGPSPSPTPLPTPSPVPAQTPAPTESALPAPAETEDPAEPPEAKPLSPWWGLLSVPALLFFLRELDLLRRKRAVTQKNTRKAALALWREAKRLCRAEEAIPAAIRQAAEHAAFGRSAPEKEALRAARTAFKALERATLQGAAPLRRLGLRLRGRLYK